MKYFIANWKMNMDSQTIETWFEKFNSAQADVFKDKTIIIAPSFPYLEEVRNSIKTPNTFVASQDVDLFDKGAHTGATGIFQIKEFCNYSIVGHSERKESLDTAIKKRDLCLENGITPIVCFVNQQDVKQVDTQGSIVAWEGPPEYQRKRSISGKRPNEIKTAINQIIEVMSATNNLIYGGSVNKDNIKDLVGIVKINGVLVGNASLDPNHFLYIIENA